MTSGDWTPRAGVDIARLRAAMLAAAREFFALREILEVDVPHLSSAAVSDPNIDSIEVRPALAAGTPHYLHTSPEFAMKRLLAADFPDIYFLGRVFRDGEAGRRHQPEFTMIEWYRQGFTLDAMIAETVALLASLLELDGTDIRRVTYREAFLDAIGADPLTAPVEALAAAAAVDDALAATLADDRNGWLDLLLATRVAGSFATDSLTVLTHYPASQAALARLTPGDADVADRFEVFLGATELANGYVELSDPVEQARRFAADAASRSAAGKPVHAGDPLLLAALDAGLPDCAGVAVGFDRLVMQKAGLSDLRDACHFPWGTST